MSDLELINIFPARYLDATEERNIGDVSGGGFALIRGAALSDVKVSYIRRNLSVARVSIMSGSMAVAAVWFNRPYVKGRVKSGAEYLFYGRVKVHRNGAREIMNPLFEPADNLKSLPGIIPVYGPHKDMPASQLKIRIRAALKKVRPQSLLPPEIIQKYGIMPLGAAYPVLHCVQPSAFAVLEAAQRAVSLESLSAKIALYRLIGSGKLGRTRFYRAGREKLDSFISGLPFKLTVSQKSAVEDIVKDLTGGSVMNRLLQGDVGSGKTAAAFCAAYFAAASGYQTAFMAPTEVLARQHYKNAAPLFDKFGIRTELLTGSMSKAQRDLALFNIRYGNAAVVIGTHALFSSGVEFRDLGLVITDEQHRFGVSQRKSLESKAGAPDTLVMSATPIPRTLSLIMYGELNVSSLTEKPHGSGAVQTSLVSKAKESDMYGFIAKEIEAGASAYFICARVGDGKDDEGDENGEGAAGGLVSAEALYKALKKTVLGKYGIGLLHGRMSEAEKSRAMARFAESKDKVLVATTVVEVGIDVKTASVIVIYDAERFGLSQLHQLRGRVGRAGQKSWCFLLSDAGCGETAERLNVFKNTPDGFVLSEYDFEKRGAGDFLGERQHGGGLAVRYETVREAKDIAEELLGDAKIKAALQKTLEESADLDELMRITMN